MKTIEELFNEYDQISATATVEERAAWLKNACEVHGKEQPTDIRGRAALYSELGSLFRNTKRYEESEEAFKKAFAIMETPVKVGEVEELSCPTCRRPDAVVGIMDNSEEYITDYATLLNNYAGLLRLTKRYNEAIDTFERVERIYVESGDVPASMMASVKNNLALVYVDKGDVDCAEKLFTEALEILKDAPEAKYEIATTYGNLAVIHFGKGLRDQAISEGKLAVQGFSECVGENHPTLIGIKKLVEQMEK